MLNFCTLFNSNYLTRGLAMYQSLEKVCPDFRLYVFAFDNATHQLLTEKADRWPKLQVISLEDFEDAALLGVKPTRTVAEYCWTCTPSTILYCIQTFQLDHCTYLDADMYFYNDPGVLINEMGNKSVLISEHRYTKAYDQSWYSGTYCVQFMVFKNDKEGMEVLQWWRASCIAWCYGRLENGKFGDQKYLDDWTTRFNCVHVLQHLGGGVAPWNVQQYDIDNNRILTEKSSGNNYSIVFFHYHGLRFYTNDMVSFCGTLYELEPGVKVQLYFPYVSELLSIEKNLREAGVNGNISGASNSAPTKLAIFVEFIKKTLTLIKEGKLSVLKGKTFNFAYHYHVYKLTHFI